MFELDKTAYFPLISVLLVTFSGVFLAEKYDDRYFHFMFFYYNIATLYGFGAYESRYLNKTPQYPVLCSIVYTLLWVPKKLLLPFDASRLDQ